MIMNRIGVRTLAQHKPTASREKKNARSKMDE
jgi:hypothetical protein